MGEQPGAGRTHSFKIKGHSRQRRAAKPYSRPSDRNKGVLESVRDFFSPSWLLDFWKGKNVVEEDESEDFDDENSGEEPAVISQDFGSSSRVMERAGQSTLERVSDTRQEVLGNGGPGFMASAQKRSRTSQKSGLSTLLALRSREPLNKKALETKTTAFASSTGEYSRSNEYPSSHMESVETQEGESLTHESRKTISDSGPSPILSSSQSKPGPSLLFGARRASTESRPSPMLSSSQSKPGPSPMFGTSLIPGASSTPVSSQSTPGPSLLSTERLSSSSRPQPTSVFRSKPEFSLSAFGSVLPSRSNLQTQRYSSPYYSGKTIFGGASSQVSSKRARISSPGSVEASKPVKRQIRPTPIAGTSGGGVTSQTAKRILETLERMSSPLEDAKKIPPSPPFATSSSPLSFSSKRRKAPPQPYNKPIGSPRKLQAQFGGPPVQSLSVPRRAVISRLQPKTVTTQMTSTPLPTPVTGKSSSKSTVKPTESFVPTPLPMSLSPMESSKSIGGGKMKKTKTSSAHYKSQAVDEEQQEVTNPLPVITSAISLPIPSGTSMPSFSFPLSSTSTKTTSTKTDSALSSHNSNSPDIPSNNFKFSAPEPRNSSNKTSSNLPNHQKINYSFSKPAPVINSENNASSSAKSPASNSFDKLKPAEGSWECLTSMVNNKPQELSCVAGTTTKPTTKPMETATKSLSTKQPSNDLFKQFQPPSGSWTCSSYMLTNKQEDQKCIEIPSSSTTEKQKPELVQPKNTLLKQFAAASDSWECPDCMLINKAQDLQCVACQANKPGEKSSKTTDNSLSKQFTPAEGSWTCETCMIVNKADVVKCIACETSKPGSSSKPTSFSAGFKVSSENKFHNSPFKFVPSDNKDSGKGIFGSSSSSSSDPFKMATTSISTTPFAFGASTTSSNSKMSFTFGSTTTTSNKVQFGSTDSSNFKFGSNEESAQLKPTFQFGKGPESKSTDAAATFKFGSTSDSTEKQPTFAFGSTAKTEKAQPDNPFTFGGNRDAKNPTVLKESPKKPAAQEPLKAGSIAQAAAAGLLKIPSSSVDVVDLTSDVSKPDLPKETVEAVAPPNVNLFGKSIASPAKSISLPKATEAKPQATASLAPLPFAFGAPSSVTKPQEDPPKGIPSFAFQASTTASTTIPKFGELTSAAVTTSAPIQGFQFGSSINSNVNTTATSGGAQLGFTGPPQQGNVLAGFSNTTKNTASPFVFKGTGDSTENKLSTPSTGFGFVPPSGNGGFSFGGTTKSSTTVETSAPFVFGAVETQKQSGFTFGSSAQQPFAFGSSNANPQASATSTVSEESMDADGNNNNNQPPVPSFGSTLVPATQSAAPFSFSTAPANAGFNFGSVQQPASFKFGDSSSNPPIFGGSSAPAFGANTGNPVQGASSGFDFGTPATNNTGSQSGGFNFSGGSTSAFTAGTGTATKRVIKRGIRRTRK